MGSKQGPIIVQDIQSLLDEIYTVSPIHREIENFVYPCCLCSAAGAVFVLK